MTTDNQKFVCRCKHSADLNFNDFDRVSIFKCKECGIYYIAHQQNFADILQEIYYERISKDKAESFIKNNFAKAIKPI